MSTQQLRESIQQLREYMFGGASSYPGPEPGRLFALNGFASQLRNLRPGEEDLKAKEKREAAKKKSADKLAALRRIATWPSRHV